MKFSTTGSGVKRPHFGWLLSSMLLATASLGQADHVRYTIIAIDTLGGTENFAYAINNGGDVVGQSLTPGDASNQSFLFKSAATTSLSPLNSGNVQSVGPTGINDHGLIASGTMLNGGYSPAIYDTRRGQITPLGSLGGVTSFGFSGVATSINDL